MAALFYWNKTMAVNLSPIGGVAGQFFDNNGNPLSGGKLYTYAASTTTPQVTYTNSSGATANSNPIILNSGGRVPAEIWLTDGLAYKFVLYTSTDTLIGSWDNIIGINSNFVNFVTSEEVQTATAGQTVFTLTTMQYQPGLNNLVVYVDGVNQVEGGTYSYVETSSTVVTFTAGLHLGAIVKFVSAETLSTGVTDASLVTFTGFKGQVGNVQDLADNDGSDWVGFLPDGTGAVAQSVQDKLRETVSVKDFGAVGDGVADDTSAIQAAIDYAYTFIITQTVFDDYGWQSRGGMTVVLPQGKYLTTSTVTIRPNVSLKGEGKSSSAIYSTYDGVILDVAPATKSGEYGKAGITLQDFMIIGDRALTTSQVGVDLLRAVGMKIIGMVINSCSAEGMILRETSNSTIIDLEIANCGGCGLMLMEGTTGYPCNANTFISPRILYNDGDGIIIADEANGNTFIGGSVERNGYATNGVGFYNIKVTSPSYVPNHFIDLWTEGPCDAHIYMNSGVSGIGTQLRLTGWKHFGDGALNSPDRALIVDSGFAKVVESTASAVSYKIINGSNSPFRVNKAGGAAIIYLENPTGATISVPTDWIEDENGNHTQLFNIALIDAPEFSLGSKSFITDAQAGDGVAYKNDAETYPWYQSRAFQKDVLIGTGSVAASSGISAGVGSPEGNKTASQGSIYMNMNGGAGVSFYVKESGTGNTGWVAK